MTPDGRPAADFASMTMPLNPQTMMFDWFHRFFRQPDDDRQRFFESIDELNANSAGGKPTLVEQQLGNLSLPSRTLVLGDPQYLSSVEIPNFATEQVTLSAKLWQYPSGSARVVKLTIRAVGDGVSEELRKIGELPIDSAKVVVADKSDIAQHWTETGNDRIGVIFNPRGDALLKQLAKRFKMKTVQINAIRAEVVGPVTEEQEQEIEDYLKSIPEYASYPFMHFHVQTNNSFDRVNYLERAWDFMPIGNDAGSPLMFVCETGRGDGAYNVRCGFNGDVPVVVVIPFIEVAP